MFERVNINCDEIFAEFGEYYNFEIKFSKIAFD